MSNEFEYQIKEWGDIKEDYSKGSLIIGNGASMALHSKFGFSSLKEKAEELLLFNEDISMLFKEFDTTDFELILRLVWHAKLINEKLNIEDCKTNQAYENIKNALIQVVREVHCTRDQIEDQLPQLYDFTKYFSTIVSLNYDLLLYWVLMFGNDSEINCDGHIFKDCFQSGGSFRDDWATLRTPIRNQKTVTLTFYQHGNLSIFRDVKNIESKLKSNINNNLLEVITDQWSDEKIPLFVAEGTGKKKEESIKTSQYLSTIYYEV